MEKRARLIVVAVVCVAIALLAIWGPWRGDRDKAPASRLTQDVPLKSVGLQEPERSDVPTKSDHASQPDASSQPEPEPEQVPPTNPEGVPLSESLPYKGMSATCLDQTWLGPHDSEGEEISGGRKAGAVPYHWIARNGTGDNVFTAYVRAGSVIEVTKNNLYSYWMEEGSVVPADKPDLYASGVPVSFNVTDEGRPDPFDYDDPDEYADDAEDWFREHGYSDPYDDAYMAWENSR